MTTQVRKTESWKIGMKRVDKIVEEEAGNGFQAVPTGIYSDGADIEIFNPSRSILVRVYEVTNYKSPEEYVKKDRAERYRRNLLKYPESEKVFVCSYEENLRYLPGGKAFFTEFGIKVIVKGNQD
jgi:hypothetical protein